MRIRQDISKPPLIPSATRRSPFSVSVDAYDVQVSPELSEEITDHDAIFDQTTSEVTHKEGKIQVDNALEPVLENRTPDICEMSPAGQLTRIVPGVAEVWVTDRGVTRPVQLDMRDSGGTSVTKIFNRVVTPSLMAHCIDQIDGRLEGMTKSENINLYTSQNHSNRTFVRNPNCWLTLGDNPVNLTKISPSNSRGNQRRAGTLITPRHVLLAAHYPLYNGDKIYFVTQDGNNTTVERTIIGSVNHPDYSPYHPDLRLHTLDSDVPATITPCKTLPSNFSSYIVHTQGGRPPTVGLDQEEKGLVTDLYGYGTRMSHITPTDPQRLAFYEDKIGGDSGNPSFLLINNELALITCWTYGGAGSGTSVPYYLNDINTLMIPAADAQAGIEPTGYTLETVDLSGFPAFT